MKILRKSFAMLIIMLAMLAICESSLAAYKYVTPKWNNWYKLQTKEKNKTIYKVTLKKDSLLIFKAKGLDEDEQLEVRVCDDMDDIDFGNWTKVFSGYNGSIQDMFVLKKGTYFLNCYLCTGKAYIAFNIKGIPSLKNTTKAKATKLKSGETATYAMMPGGCDSLWYKIKLNSPQYIYVEYDDWDLFVNQRIIEIQDAQEKRLPLIMSIDKLRWTHVCKTKKRQPAGNYYIRLKNPHKNNRVERCGYYGKFKWYCRWN